MQEVERHNFPDLSMDGSIHSPTRPQEVGDFPGCNNGGIEWYVRIPKDPPLVDLKVEMLLGQCEEDTTLK